MGLLASRPQNAGGIQISPLSHPESSWTTHSQPCDVGRPNAETTPLVMGVTHATDPLTPNIAAPPAGSPKFPPVYVKRVSASGPPLGDAARLGNTALPARGTIEGRAVGVRSPSELSRRDSLDGVWNEPQQRASVGAD